METPNIAALRAIAQLGAGKSARGPEADRHVRLAIQFAVEGALSGASHRDGARWDSSPLCWSMTCPITIRHSSRPMSSRWSCRRWQRPTSYSWTICGPTKSTGCAKQSRLLAQQSAICPPIRQTSIQSRFSKLKAALREGAKRTVKELWRFIGKLVKSFAPDQCANYFRHPGYRR